MLNQAVRAWHDICRAKIFLLLNLPLASPSSVVSVESVTLYDVMNNNITTEPAAPFLTAAELRQRWKVSGMFLWRMRQKNRLPIYKLGSRGVRFALADVLKIEAESIA